MIDFINNLTSISWWIGVVIVGILLNIASMYLKSPIDQGLSLVSTKYRTRSKAKKAEREAKIKNLIGKIQEQILYASKANLALGVGIFRIVNGASLFIVSVLFVVLGYQSLTIKNILGLRIIIRCAALYGGFMIFWGLFSLRKALDDQAILKEAKDRE